MAVERGERSDPKLVEIVAADVIDTGEEGVEVVVDGQVPSGQRVAVAGGDTKDQVRGPGWLISIRSYRNHARPSH